MVASLGVCIYSHVDTCVCLCVCARDGVCMYVYMHTCVCMYVCIHTYVCMYVYIHTYICMYVCMYVRMHMYVRTVRDREIGTGISEASKRVPILLHVSEEASK